MSFRLSDTLHELAGFITIGDHMTSEVGAVATLVGGLLKGLAGILESSPWTLPGVPVHTAGEGTTHA